MNDGRTARVGLAGQDKEGLQMVDEPITQRITSDLRKQIEDGTLGPGALVPSEVEVAQGYSVSRQTARAALQRLEHEGLVVVRPRRGRIVRKFRPIVRNGTARLADTTWTIGQSIWAAETEGRDLIVDDVRVREEEAPERIAQVLDLPAQDRRVLIRSRRYILDGKPVLVSSSYLPAELVSGSAIAQPDTGPGGTYARLKDLGHAPAHFREDLRARMPEPAEARDLELPPGTPIVEIARTAYEADGRVVEVNEMIADASAYIFRYDFDA